MTSTRDGQRGLAARHRDVISETIAEVRIHRVNIPLDAPYRWSPGLYFGASKGIVEVVTESGHVGIGEIADVDACDAFERDQAPRLVGANAMDLEGCRRLCVPEITALKNTHGLGPIRAFAAIELALWDIKGQVLGVPIHMLLGGLARTEVSFSEYFAFRPPGSDAPGERTPVAVARYCARMREEHGSTVFEGKVGLSDPTAELAMVKEVRAAVGDDATLRLDANAGWDPLTARRMVRALAPLEIANIEDPASSYRAMAKLRRHTDIPFSGHVPDLPLAVELGVPDTIVLNTMSLGGLRETVAFVDACEAMDVGFWCYSGDSAIGTTAYLHMSAALPYMEQPHQSLLRWYIDDVIDGGPLSPENGVLAVPMAPGLGVRLDRERLQRAADDFQTNGVITQLGIPGDRFYPRLRRQ
jgi:glucarate dehydratase